MSRIERRTPRAHLQLSAHQVLTLATGRDWFGEWNTSAGDVDRAAMQSAWQDLGAELLALHIRHYPGSRPFGWWEFQARERRQRIDAGLHPHDRLDFPQRHRSLYYGCPAILRTEDCFAATYETQEAYVRRLRLLSAEEKRVLALRAIEQDDDEQDEGGMSVERETPTGTLEQIKAWMVQS